MAISSLPLDQILTGDCIEMLAGLPEKSVDLIFADPPYNLQLQQELWRPNSTRVDAVNDSWDQFAGFQEYDNFSRRWLTACRRVLKDSGTVWVIGSYHNIYRLGAIMQDLGFWFLNDILWIKTNPMPNFRGVRFTNAHETLLWASKAKGARYTFNHQAMKALNEGLQMRSDWLLPICSGPERIKENGKKVHSTQKPEALLYRIILSSSHAEDVVLDPFFGTGTTGAVARKLGRHWIGIEQDEGYIRIAQQRIDNIPAPISGDAMFAAPPPKSLQPRVTLGALLAHGLLLPGQNLYFRGNLAVAGRIYPDGRLELQNFSGSIHETARHLSNGSPCNGWETWYYENGEGQLAPIAELRKQYLLAGSQAVNDEE
jgi:site-specific DNA-methyltransferase (adenine-specific)